MHLPCADSLFLCSPFHIHVYLPDALHAQAEESTLSLEEGMSFYGLTSSELFWERASDTKMLMAWNRNTVVVAFRGTASINNAWSDLQVSRGISTVSEFLL